MYLALAATEMEMRAFEKAAGNIDCHRLVTGLGLVETTLSLTGWLRDHGEEVAGVIHFGVAGAYLHNGTAQTAQLLELCLATHEVLGDLGVCLEDAVEEFSADILQVKHHFVLDERLLARAEKTLSQAGLSSKKGRFITVQCVSGTEKRGNLLGRKFTGLCENMEGAAVARVCDHFSLPCLEIRCVSNLVEDRNPDNWQLKKACRKAGDAAALILRALTASA